VRALFAGRHLSSSFADLGADFQRFGGRFWVDPNTQASWLLREKRQCS
jgi:hypothetical protein